jgi:transcriptional regulator with XRE-family HTH domain
MHHEFRERLQQLMKGDKPYSWARKVGIEKGLFQYYWQKSRIPTYDNLMKIQKYTGCSLDWLLAGIAVNFDQIDGFSFVKETSPVYGKQNLKRNESLEKVKAIYASRNESDMDILEGFLARIVPSSGKKAAPAKKASKKKS